MLLSYLHTSVVFKRLVLSTMNLREVSQSQCIEKDPNHSVLINPNAEILGEGRLVGWFLVLLLHHLGMWCRMGVASRSVWFSLWVSVWQTNISSRMTHILAPGVATNI